MDEKKPAYLVVDTAIENPENYEEYKKLARPIAEKFEGQYLTRGGAMEVVQSELWSPTRIVIIKFPNYKNAKNFLESPEYKPVKQIRLNNSKATSIIVEGL